MKYYRNKDKSRIEALHTFIIEILQKNGTGLGGKTERWAPIMEHDGYFIMQIIPDSWLSQIDDVSERLGEDVWGEFYGGFSDVEIVEYSSSDFSNIEGL